MGKVLSIVSNPFKNFNLESRAHKVISQSKPSVAPRHKKDEIDIQRLMQDYPEAYEDSLKKNELLDKRLKDVYVTSRDANINIKERANPDRPLPLDRTTVEDFIYGAKEPDKIPLGKTTLRDALEFITRHQDEPQTYNAKRIADQYTIPEETVKNVLKYFRVFEVYIPDRKTKAKFAGPSAPKVHIIKRLKKQLPMGSAGDEKT